MLAITAFCDTCVTAFLSSLVAARAGSPIAKARAALGPRAFADVTNRAMHAHARRVLLGDPAARVREIEVHGDLAVRAMVTDVVAATVIDVIREANVVETAA